MSVVISYVSDLISVIATDTRISYGNNMHDINKYNDNIQKLHDINIGWCAGVGLEEFIKEIKICVNNTKIGISTQIIDIYYDTLEKLKNITYQRDEEIDLSAVLLSYITSNKNELNPIHRIMMISKNTIKENKRYNTVINNNFHIYYPMDFIENEILIKNLTEKYDMEHTFNNDIDLLLKDIFQIFKFVSEKSKQVSNICDIGIMRTIKGEIFKINIKGNIDDLMDALESNTLQKYTKESIY